MTGRWIQFFEVKGELSLRNLTTLLTIANAILVMDFLAITGRINGDTFVNCFVAVLLAGGGVYGFGKWQDEKTKRFEIDSTPPPAPVTTVSNANVVNTAEPQVKA